MLGRPGISEPVRKKVIAGAWFTAPVCIDLTKQRSSAIEAISGKKLHFSTGVHIEGLESADDPAADGQEAVVFTWSMRDNVQTAAAAWRPGDVVNLRLRPWADVSGEYEAINRSELDDEAVMLAEPVWGELDP